MRKKQASFTPADIGTVREPSSTASPRSTPKPAGSSPFAALASESARATEAEATEPPHVIVKALAGTGKTTTLVEGLKRLRGLPNTIEPSPQQQAVWDQIMLSAGQAKSVCFCAFNRSIAEELQARVPHGCDAKTLHGLGVSAVNRIGRFPLNQHKVRDVLAKLCGFDDRFAMSREKAELAGAVDELVGLCKCNLYDGTDEQLEELVSRHQVVLPGGGQREETFHLVRRVLERCAQPQLDGCIDFDDMVWLPVKLGLSMFRYDLLLVDESQDLNRCQQALAKMAGKRLIFVGDEHQAIYGFAGADAESLQRLEADLAASPRGCVVLPLTVTRRCGKAIVAEARKYVAEFEAHEGNGEGKVSQASIKDTANPSANGVYTQKAEDGSFVLCRKNAPLVKECFRFLRAGKKARIQGRSDVGKGLIDFVERLAKRDGGRNMPLPAFIVKLEENCQAERAKEAAKRNPSDSRLDAIEDRRDTVLAFCEDKQTVGEVIDRINAIFTDERQVTGIRLSSIHKAKGLEAKRVFWLCHKEAQMPEGRMAAWERQQERNLRYVAVTRAVEELVIVS